MMQHKLSIVEGDVRVYNFDLIHRRIEDSFPKANDKGNKTAIISNDSLEGEKRISFDEMNKKSNKIANYLLNEAAKREVNANQDGDWLIGVCMHTSEELIITLLSILKTGAAYLPIDPMHPRNRIEHMVNESKPIFIIYDHMNIDRKLFGKIIALSYNECNNQSYQLDEENLPDEKMWKSLNKDLALVQYTSGSTGLPKGVRLSHSMILNRLQWQFEAFPYCQTEKICIFKTVFSFVDSLQEIWGPLLNQRTILVVPQRVTKDPSEFIAILEKYKIKRLALVPHLLKSILSYLSLQNNKNRLSELKLVTSAGEILPQYLAIEFYNYFRDDLHVLCNFYGTTEVAGDVTYYIIEGKQHASKLETIPIGFPVFNTQICVLDTNKNPVKCGVLGELYVSGNNVTLGYVNGRENDYFCRNPFSSETHFSRLYHTGDLAVINKNGVIHFRGRTDSQIKIRGNRVDLNEIEYQLMSIKGVEQTVVLIYRSRDRQTIVAFIAFNSSLILNMFELKKILKTKLPDYLLPAMIQIDNNMPLLLSGKIDRQKLLDLYEENRLKRVHSFDYDGVSDENYEKTKTLYESIAEIADRSMQNIISLSCNFFEIGGNSMNTIEVIAELKTKGFLIDISKFLSAANLGEIIMHMVRSDDVQSLNNSLIHCREPNIQLTSEPLENKHKIKTLSIIATSFFKKSELDKYLNVKINLADYIEFISQLWTDIIDSAHSFVVKDENGRIVGVALNFNANRKPQLTCNNNLRIELSIFESVINSILESLLTNNLILFSFMMGTHYELSAQENLLVICFMETELLRIAKNKNYIGIITINSNALTQQLATCVNGYETLDELQLNKFIFEGVKPFSAAPDACKVTIDYKKF